MDDFTKIKLINSLIDLVDRFYQSKDELSSDEIIRLKGFCEGFAYSLKYLDIIDEDESKKILKGLGKKRDADKIYKKETNSRVDENKEVKDIKKEILHDLNISYKKDKNEDSLDLDLPTFLRKNKSL